jgi:ADP-ribose pyrophosphatase YjhB (NUDIX family)
VKVRHLLTPTGKSFPGFYVDNWTKDWATTLVLLPGNLVVLTGEYKHGQDEVVIVPPSGVPKRGFTEEETMMGCATREFKEETGLTLTSIVPLGGPQAVSARNINCRYFPFLGEVAEPIVAEEVQRDITERLAVVLCPIEEWFTLIKLGRGIEQCSASIAFLYMLAQGRLGRA